MNFQFDISTELFLLYLIINSAGYNYENNPSGKNPIRINFKQLSTNLLTNKNYQNLVKECQKKYTSSNQYPRFVNHIMTECILNKNNKNIINQIDSVLADPIFQSYLNEYKTECQKYQNSNLEIKHLIEKVLHFCNITNIDLNLTYHLNLLDSYQRGTNYYSRSRQIIATSLSFNNTPPANTIIHEFIHIILKHITPANLDIPKITAPDDYKDDNNQTIFDENFVLASCLFFSDNPDSHANHLKYYYDKGFTDIKKFYQFIDENFLKNKDILNEETIKKMRDSI